MVPILYPASFAGTQLSYSPGLLVILHVRSDGSPYEKRVDAKGHVLSEECIVDEVPYDIPDSWEWARLESIADIVNGFTPKKSEAQFWNNGKVPWFTALDIRAQGRIINWTEQTITPLAMGKRKMCPPDTVLICCTASVGEVALTKIPLVTNQQFNSLIQLRKEECRLVPRYLLLWSRTIKHQLIEVAGTTTIPFVSVTKLGKLLIPIPSVAEQRRIVECISQLMPLVKEYGKLEDAREELDAALSGRLRKSVLQMAVQGKLVPQDPADEPASALLERIREQRRQLVAEKKMKAPKGGESVIFAGSDGRRYEKRVDAKGRESDPVCIEDEIPFEIPDSWEWVRLEGIGDWKAGATPAKSKPEYYANGTIPWLLTGDLNDGIINEIPNNITEQALEECSVRLNPAGSVLIAMYGATIGRIGVLGIPATTNQACCACILHDDAIREWLTTWLLFYKPHFVKLGMGGAQPNISRGVIVSRILPLPPLAEQRRIVERVRKILSVIG